MRGGVGGLAPSVLTKAKWLISKLRDGMRSRCFGGGPSIAQSKKVKYGSHNSACGGRRWQSSTGISRHALAELLLSGAGIAVLSGVAGDLR